MRKLANDNMLGWYADIVTGLRFFLKIVSVIDFWSGYVSSRITLEGVFKIVLSLSGLWQRQPNLIALFVLCRRYKWYLISDNDDDTHLHDATNRSTARQHWTLETRATNCYKVATNWEVATKWPTLRSFDRPQSFSGAWRYVEVQFGKLETNWETLQ